MATNVLAFPEAAVNEVTKCSGCGKPGDDDTLSVCATCGDKMCSDCDECSCHELIDYLLGLRPSLFTRIRRLFNRGI
ncbi:MAG TPA: hypothetical protein VG075_11110 [Candidatus Acidoferrum sp.]|nr:hypothetical protein [Candidatus Acidoferrum sp.]